MGVITYDMVTISSISAVRMFQAFVLDGDNLIPQLLPDAIQAVEIIHGDGGPGTVKLTTFGEVAGSHFRYVKNRIDDINTEEMTYRYSIIEGDVLNRGLKSISYVIKMEDSGTGGSICSIRSTYYTEDYDVQITEEQIRSGKDEAMVIFKAVESYLEQNPHAYNFY